MRLDSHITQLKGIGDKTALLLKKLDIETLEDLVTHFPKDYEMFQPPVLLSELKNNEKTAFFAKVVSQVTTKKVRNLMISSFFVGNGTDTVKITFFNMPYISKTITLQKEYLFYGSVAKKGDQYIMEHPKMFSKEEYVKIMGTLQPIYTKTKGLSNDAIKKAIKNALNLIEEPVEYLPKEVVEKHSFLPFFQTIQTIHNPQSKEELVIARKRITYEEFFFFILSLKMCRQMEADHESDNPFVSSKEIETLIKKLPFELTNSQQKVWNEIEQDLTSGTTLNRLLQGDVGSGKTIIAVLALLLCVVNGYQGALMAPTEVLAIQHFETITELCETYQLPFKPVVLVGSLTAKQKKEAKLKLADGTCNLVIGTHALIQEDVLFKNLALVVTDEQHRFGVKQRETLTNKGKSVHTLVMSATPIPRSLAIILYGELSISTIPELPANRLPIKNCVVNTTYRPKAYSFIEKEVKDGRQAFVICPMIESGVMDELENVIDYTRELKSNLPEAMVIAYLHGKMKPAEKNKIMLDFSNKKIDVLVSTTVIEVGINVPNATVMMVENADRFGLATLHQIRGRVGRGKYQSYCIFIDSKENDRSKKRLDILNQSNDGFFIANEDLKLRGPGDLMGTFQSGEFMFRYADIYADSQMLLDASEDIAAILKKDPLLIDETHITLKEKLSQRLKKEYLQII